MDEGTRGIIGKLTEHLEQSKYPDLGVRLDLKNRFRLFYINHLRFYFKVNKSKIKITVGPYLNMTYTK